jgi:hypothetical protein
LKLDLGPTAPGTVAVVAVVDEGILSLTNFKTPIRSSSYSPSARSASRPTRRSLDDAASAGRHVVEDRRR